MRYALIFFIFITLGTQGQSLRDINFSYLYSSKEPVALAFKPIRNGDEWTVFYQLKLKDSVSRIDDFSIQWEIRDGLNTKEGKPIADDQVMTVGTGSGQVKLKNSNTVQILVAKVKRGDRLWLFYTMLEPKFPADGYIKLENDLVTNQYVPVGATGTSPGSGRLYVAYYNDAFPPATPAFAEAAGKVSPKLKVDSSWVVDAGESLSFPLKGLYLFQQDTASAEGFAVRADSDYPRLSKVENLAEPLTYICTSQELGRFRQIKGDKKAFDRAILSITMDQDRARKLMRNYFRRVELANQFFTSYKEGWKTDRGMIFIVFGPPDKVFKTSERELWYYDNSNYKIDFEFTKSPTLFDPENFVLLRHKKYETTVYEVIDLWRNARI